MGSCFDSTAKEMWRVALFIEAIAYKVPSRMGYVFIVSPSTSLQVLKRGERTLFMDDDIRKVDRNSLYAFSRRYRPARPDCTNRHPVIPTTNSSRCRGRGPILLPVFGQSA